jgi:hypothetical protein
MTVADSSSFSVGETITGGTSGSTASVITKPTSTTFTITIPSGDFTASETITGSSSSATTTVSANPSLVDAQSTVDLLEVVIRRDNTDINVSRISRAEYLNIPNKTQQGRPTQYFVDRLITPTINLWPTPENSTDQLIFYRVKRIQDADAGTNNPDVPFRFLPCLVAGLAYHLAVKKSPQRIGVLKDIYEEEFARAAAEDGERTALRLVPSYSSLNI